MFPIDCICSYMDLLIFFVGTCGLFGSRASGSVWISACLCVLSLLPSPVGLLLLTDNMVCLTARSCATFNLSAMDVSRNIFVFLVCCCLSRTFCVSLILRSSQTPNSAFDFASCGRSLSVNSVDRMGLDLSR